MSYSSPFAVDSPRLDRSIDLRAAGASAAHETPPSDDPRELWSRLVDGQFKISEYFNASGRCYLVLATRVAGDSEVSRLTSRELEIVTRTLLGVQQKVTAFDLGLAPSTVAAHQARALQKLDLFVSARTVPLALVLLCQAACGGRLHGDLRVTEPQGSDGDQVVVSFACPENRLLKLSAAEQDVAIALVAGAGKAEIAGARLTSINTVGRQISSIYTKLGVKGRFDLVRLMGGEALPTGSIDVEAEPVAG